MIQFNLLPDIKQEYIKTQHVKRLVIGISLILSAIFLFILLLLIFSVYIVQKGNINNLNNKIQTDSVNLKDKPNIATILTVQSQLNSLSSLDRQNPAASRLFNYLYQIVPTQATISDLNVDFSQNTLIITGNAPSLDIVNAFVDNLKYTSYTISGESNTQNAFTSVVLASFGRSQSSATYTINFSFDPVIFNNADTISLSVGGNPPLTASQQPSIIFKKGN
jgi:Tfp pilus assembly protein PilN